MFVVDRLIVCVGEGMILNYSKFTHVHTHSTPATAASECVSAVQLDNIALGVVDVTVDAPENNNCRQPTHEPTNQPTHQLTDECERDRAKVGSINIHQVVSVPRLGVGLFNF